MNTGYKKYGTLTEVDADTGIPTGVTKPNVPGDPDYVPPVIDYVACPTTTTTTAPPELVFSQVNNYSEQILNFDELKIWYENYPGGFQQGSQQYLSGTQNPHLTVYSSDDFIYIKWTAGIFTLGLPVIAKLYYQLQGGANNLIRTFTIYPFTSGVERYIPVPRSGIGGTTDTIILEFTDI